MFTRNFFFIALSAFLQILFFSCKENPEERTESQLQQIIAELEKDNNFSGFTTALKSLNISDEEITVLAFSNDALNKSGKEKAGSGQKQTSITEAIISKHIIKKAYTIEELKKITAVEALNGELLSIETNENGDVTINGVKLSGQKIIGKSVIFYISEMITGNSQPLDKITFEVWECNQNLSPENPHEAQLSQNATINIYTTDNKLYRTFKTNDEGQASFWFREGDTFYYEVKNGEKSNLYWGYKIKGVFLTQQEVDNYPDYENSYIKAIGQLKFADINGDGIINESDKVELGKVTTTTESLLKVYIAEELRIQTISIEEHLEANRISFSTLQNEYTRTDNNYSDLTQRHALTPNHPAVTDSWSKAFKSIRMSNSLTDRLDEGTGITEDEKQRYKGTASYYRGTAHFYLSTLFGNIPIVTQYTEPTLNQSSESEIIDFILSELNQAITSSPATLSDSARFIKSLVLLKQGSMEESKKELLQILNSTAAQHTNPQLIQVCLLLGDISLAQGNTFEAIQLVNTVYEYIGIPPKLTLISTKEEVKTCIKETFAMNNMDEGLKFLNKIRWGETDNWDKYTLFPIPEREFNYYSHWTQNPGW